MIKSYHTCLAATRLATLIEGTNGGATVIGGPLLGIEAATSVDCDPAIDGCVEGVDYKKEIIRLR